jgi:2-dehydro-3-deoxyphosphogluconate aldolase / (4S)-4-hydroxy-2-oxoglutarate aldolase
VNPLKQLSELRVVPVVVLEDSALADPLADALVSGGLPCAEVTLRTNASFSVIASLARRGDILVGAGTVLTADDVDRAVDAGAHFLVSPGFDRDVTERAQSANLPFIPGVATATEVQQALRVGLTNLKFFPAEPAGGLAVINALHGPFPSVRFMPTGGITLDTLTDYLSHPAIYAVGGSWMVPKSCLDAGDFTTVEQLTRETVTHIATPR